MRRGARNTLSPSAEIAYIAVMCALLIGGQYIFSFVAGVEIVTLLLACFSAVLGGRRGAMCGVAFSLLRCLVFGFYPSVVVLYLIYYPLFAVVFGALGGIPRSFFEEPPLLFVIAVNVLLLGLAAACGLAALLGLIVITRVWRATLTVLLWVIAALCTGLCLSFDALLFVKKRLGRDTSALMRVIAFTAVAAVCTVCFSLLDDVITPLFYGFSREAALTWFYTSFTAMLPQTVCTVVTMCTLFAPVTAVLERVRRR